MPKQNYKKLFKEIQEARLENADGLSVLYDMCGEYKLSKREKENLLDTCVSPSEYTTNKKEYAEWCREDKQFKKNFPTMKKYNELARDSMIEGLMDGPAK